MNHCGAPDLPFIETILWYLKQMGAGVCIIMMFIAVIVIATIIRGALSKDKT